MANKIAFIGFILLISNLQAMGSAGKLYISEAFQTYFSTVEKPGAKVLWKRDDFTLYWKQDLSLLESKFYSDDFYGVAYTKDSFLAGYLHNNRHLVHFLKEQDGLGYSLVQLKTAEQQKIVAELAHDVSGFGCGNLQKVRGLDLSGSSVEHLESIVDPSFPINSVVIALEQVEASRLEANIQEFSEAFSNRHYQSEEGIQTPGKIVEMIQARVGGKLTYETILSDVSAGGAEQQNLVVRVVGAKKPDELVIFGCHMDTTLRGDPSGANKGADDNASGVATLIEMLQVIADNGFEFDRTLEFHFYAAEEVGLLGSGVLAENYRSSSKKVAAMAQYDMDTFSHEAGSLTVYLVENDTSSILRRFSKDLFHTYLDGDYEVLALAGGSSDHASWTRQGYPAVFHFEHPEHYNKALHTTNDTMATANRFDLAVRHVQIGLGYAAHMGGLVGAQAVSQSYSSDVKLSISQGGSSGWDLVVSSDTSVASFEICRTSGPTATSCTSEHFAFETPYQTGGRSFAKSVDSAKLILSEADINYLIISGYTNKDKIAFRRTLQVSKI